MKNKKAIFYISFFMLLGIVFIWYAFPLIKAKEKSNARLPVYGANETHRVDPFSFVNQDGKTITNADVKDKICVVSFFYATCPNICPKMNENMTQVYKAYKGNKDVIILSHTVNPKHDSVPVLKAYSLRFDADPAQWMFLTGDKAQLYKMARESYMMATAEDTVKVSIDKDFIHDQHFILVDGDGRVRGIYDGLTQSDVTKLIADIGTLLKEKK